MNAIATEYSDLEGQKQFEVHTQLLHKVQVGSPVRATGAAFTAAKKEYQEHLKILQPIGQTMLERAIGALEQIKNRLVLPEGFTLRRGDYHSKPFGKFEAGVMQLNEDGSLYVAGPKGAGGVPVVDIEVRLFTRKVRAFVPVRALSDRGYAVSEDIFDGKSFVYGDSYSELVDKITFAVQQKLDAVHALNNAQSDELSDEDAGAPRP